MTSQVNGKYGKWRRSWFRLVRSPDRELVKRFPVEKFISLFFIVSCNFFSPHCVIYIYILLPIYASFAYHPYNPCITIKKIYAHAKKKFVYCTWFLNEKQIHRNFTLNRWWFFSFFLIKERDGLSVDKSQYSIWLFVSKFFSEFSLIFLFSLEENKLNNWIT